MTYDMTTQSISHCLETLPPRYTEPSRTGETLSRQLACEGDKGDKVEELGFSCSSSLSLRAAGTGPPALRHRYAQAKTRASQDAWRESVCTAPGRFDLCYGGPQGHLCTPIHPSEKRDPLQNPTTRPESQSHPEHGTYFLACIDLCSLRPVLRLSLRPTSISLLAQIVLSRSATRPLALGCACASPVSPQQSRGGQQQ
jgi:hypothetical protein